MMRRFPSSLVPALILLGLTVPRSTPFAAETSAGQPRGMVVCVSPAAAMVGREVLRNGGNAVDAAVATAFAMAVTWPSAGNIGGGGFMMVAPGAGQRPVCIEYRETAPAAANERTLEKYASMDGHLVCGTPGTVAGLALAHRTYGSRPWRELVMPAVRLAREGIAVNAALASSLNGALSSAKPFAEMQRVFAPPSGAEWRAGDRLVQPDLANTLERIATDGPAAFYTGAIADQIVAEMQAGGGLISKQDLAGYQAKAREPIHGTYRGYDVFGPPPPSSGGTCLIQMLNILENFELEPARERKSATPAPKGEARQPQSSPTAVPRGEARQPQSSPTAVSRGEARQPQSSPLPFPRGEGQGEGFSGKLLAQAPAVPPERDAEPRWTARTMHLVIEAMRRSYRDRARWLGDGDFVKIPANLTTKEYARELARQIDLERATPSESLAGDIPLADESPETTHFSVIDRNGMAVSNTYTLQNGYGSRVVVRGAGFLLNNEMTDFNRIPGRTDRTGAIGTSANLIAPGKRMLSSQTPTLVFRDGRLVLVTGSPGGRTIINTVLCTLVNYIDFQSDVAAAVAGPRLHHPWFPDRVSFEGLERPEYATVIEQLRRMGHKFPEKSAKQGDAHSIGLNRTTGRYESAADRRVDGSAEEE